VVSIANNTCNVTHLPPAVTIPATQDMPVFPCRPDKKPYTGNGFKNATYDPHQIIKWWEKWPDALIGMPTGKMSGYCILDVDIKNDVDGTATLHELEQANNKLPDTWATLTPSGGFHYWFKYPGQHIQTSAGKIGQGLDIRGEGGYVIIPPSKGYQWEISNPEICAEMPAWLIQECNKPRNKKVSTKNSAPIAIAHKGSLWRERLSYLSRLQKFPAGEYEAEFIGWTVIKHPGQKLRKGEVRIEMRFRVYAASRHFEISGFHSISILQLPRMQGQISTGRCSQLAKDISAVIGGIADDGFPIQINLDDISLDVFANKRLRVFVGTTSKELKSQHNGGFRFDATHDGYAIIRAITASLPPPSVDRD